MNWMKNTITGLLIAVMGLAVSGSAWALTDAEIFAQVKSYKFDQPRTGLAELEKRLGGASAEECVKLEAQMLAVLQSKDATRLGKDGICRLLQQYGSARSIPVLAKLVTDKELGHSARYALLPRTEPEAGEALRDALKTAAPDQKVGLISTLADRHDTKAVPLLAKLVEDDNALLASRALRALGRIGGADARKALEKAKVSDALASERSHALLDCADTILEAGGKKEAASMFLKVTGADQPVPIRVAAYRGLAMAQEEKAVSTVLALLREKNPRLQKAASGLIVAMPGAEATKAFASELVNLTPEAQVVLLGALTARGDREASGQVLSMLKSDDTNVRIASVQALAVLGDASCVQELTKAVGDKDDAVRKETLRTLGRLTGVGVDQAIAKELKSDQAPVRLALVTCLISRGASDMMQALLACAKDSDAGVRRQAQKGLVDFAQVKHLSSLFELLGALENDADCRRMEKAVKAAFGRGAGMKPEEQERMLLDAWAKAKTPATRASLLALLAEQTGPGALKAIEGALKDKDERVLNAAVSALVAWPNASPRTTLTELAKSGSSKLIKYKALRGCARMVAMIPGATPEKSLALYEDVLKLAVDADAQKQVFIALSQAPSPMAQGFLDSHVNDADVGAEAKNAKVMLAKQQSEMRTLKDSVTLEAKIAKLHGSGIDYEARRDRECIGNWSNSQGWASWTILVVSPGTYAVQVLQAKQGGGGGKYEVSIGKNKVTGTVKDNGTWDRFVTVSIGDIKVDRAGQYQVAIRAHNAPAPVMNLRAIILKKK